MNDQSRMPIVPKVGFWESFKNTALAVADAIDGDGPEADIMARLVKLEDRVSQLEEAK
jgi:hypothetical protein